MKLVYADPPYLGQCGKKYDHFHNDGGDMPWDGRCWDEQLTHEVLLAWLATGTASGRLDGWAYSCNPVNLDWISPGQLGARAGFWGKTFHQIHGVATQYATEIVVFREPRSFSRKPKVVDWVTGRIAMMTGQPGAKPDYFNDWILDLLCCEVGDEFIDLFPGSGGMARALERRSRRLAFAPPEGP